MSTWSFEKLVSAKILLCSLTSELQRDCVGESQGNSSILSLIPLHVYSHLNDNIHFPTSKEASSNVFNTFVYLVSSFKQPMSQLNRLDKA